MVIVGTVEKRLAQFHYPPTALKFSLYTQTHTRTVLSVDVSRGYNICVMATDLPLRLFPVSF